MSTLPRHDISGNWNRWVSAEQPELSAAVYKSRRRLLAELSSEWRHVIALFGPDGFDSILLTTQATDHQFHLTHRSPEVS